MPDGLDDLLGGSNDSGTAPSGEPGGSGGGQLRRLYEEQLQQNKALAEQLASLQKAERGRSLDALFEKHGVPGLAKDFFPSDGELTDEAVTGFVGKYGALWGASADAATTPSPEQQAAARIANASLQAPPIQPGPGQFADYESKLGEAKSRDEVLQIFAQLAAAQA
jgi:hypothetical protein